MSGVSSRSLSTGADDKSDEVEVPCLVYTCKCGGFASKQRAVGIGAGVGDALDETGDQVLFQLAHANVVEEEQRRRARRQNVVNAMVDDVVAKGVVAPERPGDADLRPHRVGTRHE